MVPSLSKEAAIGIALPFAGSIVGSIIVKQNIKTWYNTKLKKPWWRPPNWLFGPVWTALYGSMGYASYLIWKDGGGFNGEAALPLAIYGSQLALNWAYTPLFFGLKNIKLALIDIIALDVGIVMTMWKFSSINSSAALILTPYLCWVSFASLLTGWIYINNKSDNHLD